MRIDWSRAGSALTRADLLLRNHMSKSAATTRVGADESNGRQRKPLTHVFRGRRDALHPERWRLGKRLLIASGEVKRQAHSTDYSCAKRGARATALARAGSEH